MSYKLDITIEMGASNRTVRDTHNESKINENAPKYSYLRTRAKKETMKAITIAAFINGMNNFPKAVLQPLFSI